MQKDVGMTMPKSIQTRCQKASVVQRQMYAGLTSKWLNLQQSIYTAEVLYGSSYARSGLGENVTEATLKFTWLHVAVVILKETRILYVQCVLQFLPLQALYYSVHCRIKLLSVNTYTTVLKFWESQ